MGGQGAATALVLATLRNAGGGAAVKSALPREALASMKTTFRLALALGLAVPFAAPVAAQTRSVASARVLRRARLASAFPMLSLRANLIPAHIGAPRGGVSVAAAQTRATGTLGYNFVGYTDAQKAELSGFLQTNAALITQVWGNPAPEQAGKTVTITSVAGAATYFPPATDASAGQIEFGYVNTGILNDNPFRLLKLVLLAYQGPRVPSFNYGAGSTIEPYSLGASEAAALQILYLAQGSPASFDPRSYVDYVLPFYDAFNAPALGNAFIYSPDGRDVAVSDFRLAMAQAAFLKLFAERATFFSDFNAALYARGSARSAVSADDLETLVAGVVPTVEGLPARAWLREQNALNARVRSGNKLLLIALPSRASTTGDTRPPVAVYAEAFATDASGNDSPLFAGAPTDGTGAALPAYGTLDALDETGRNVNAFSSELVGSSVLSFNSTTSPGEATKAVSFTPFGTPTPARVTLRARLNAVEGTTIYPFGAAGTTTAPATFFGATLGGTSGSVTVASNGQSQTVPVVRGTFSATLAPASGPRVQTTLAVGGQTFVRNSAWLAPGTTVRSLEFLLPGAGAAVVTSTLAPNTANGQLKMIAFPLRPVLRDEASALGIPAASLALARYRPDLSPAVSGSGGLSFGIGGSKYEIYPNISQGPEAGRGYWLKVPTTGYSAPVAGTFPPANQNAEVELKGGWNQIGAPRATAVDIGSVQVRFGGYSPVSLQEAQNRGWVAPGVWRYDGNQGYVRADVVGGSLVPWEGYWVFASPGSGVHLVFPATSSAPASRALTAASGWSVGLVAASSRSRDTSASFGVSTATPAAKPPVAARQLSLYFPPTGAASASGGGTAQGFLKTLIGRGEWHFTLDGATQGERVTLSWPRFGAPANVRLFLRDDATDTATWIRAGGSVSLISNGAPRRFTVIGVVVGGGKTSAGGS